MPRSPHRPQSPSTPPERGTRRRSRWPRLWAGLAAAAVVFAVTLPTKGGVAAAATSGQAMGIPAYFYPAGAGVASWDQLRTGAPTLNVVIATGLRLETTTPDTNYQAQIAKTRAAGIKVLAYVTTTGGDKPAATAKQEMDRAFAWYNADGIFFDESVRYPVTCGQVDYYRSLHQHAKYMKRGAMTVLNHGQILPECYAEVADVLMTAEMSAANYKSGWRPWGWEQNYPPSKFWHLVHSTPTIAEMKEIVTLSRSRNAGRIFVTSAGMASPAGPYGSLPSADYWAAELAAVSAALTTPTTVAPTTTSTVAPTTTSTVAPTTTSTVAPTTTSTVAPVTTTTVAPAPSTTTTLPPAAYPAPAITSFSPTSGPPGSTVVLSGRGLANTAMVTLGGSPVQILSKSDTSLTVRLNTWNATGTFWLYVTGGLSATAPGVFTVVR